MKATIFTIVFFCLMLFNIGVAQILPTLPNTASIEACFPDTIGYKRITVGPSGRNYTDLQKALDAAQPGTVIILDAGIVYTGGFVLPVKPASTRWIVLMGSRMDLLPKQGFRVDPTAMTGDPRFTEQRLAMPSIVTTNLSGIPCFNTEPGAHHYRLVGLEISAATAVLNSYGLINFGNSGTAQNQVWQIPNQMVLDRCYVHGHPQASIMKYGIRLDCSNGAVLDCHISDFHSIGFDAQAISGINGPGPFKIINNYLEASGENILFGGGAPSISNLVPADIEVLNNHFSKPLSWWVKDPSYAGKHWTVKNLFELKTGKRVLLEGNLMEYCWADLPIGQSGYAILLTIRTEGGAAPQADVSDVTIRSNSIRHTGVGISISGSDDGTGNRSKRILIQNNLLEDINGPKYGDQNVAGPNDGTAFHLGEPQDVTIDHNSIFQSGAITWAYKKMSGFRFTNNLVNSLISSGGYQGIYGPGVKQGDATFAMYFPDVTDANKQFHKNVLISGDASKYANFKSMSQNYFPPKNSDVAFVDFNNGPNNLLNYKLKSNSAYSKNGSDGKDIGADLDELISILNQKRDCPTTPVTVSNSNQDHEIHIFPNPFTNQLHVSTSNKALKQVYLLNSIGQQLIKMDTSLDNFELDCSFIPPGMYELQIHQGNTFLTNRILKF